MYAIRDAMYAIRDSQGQFVGRSRTKAGAHRRTRTQSHLGASVNRAGYIVEHANRAESSVNRAFRRTPVAWTLMPGPKAQWGASVVYADGGDWDYADGSRYDWGITLQGPPPRYVVEVRGPSGIFAAKKKFRRLDEAKRFADRFISRADGGLMFAGAVDAGRFVPVVANRARGSNANRAGSVDPAGTFGNRAGTARAEYLAEVERRGRASDGGLSRSAYTAKVKRLLNKYLYSPRSAPSILPEIKAGYDTNEPAISVARRINASYR